MRKTLFISLCLVIGTCLGLQAQVALSDTSIVQYLERPEIGGQVRVVQPEELAKRVTRAQNVIIKYDGDRGYTQESGYRIQVFYSNDYRTAKSKTESREKMIQSEFPELPTYAVFTSPFWRLRVGDFRTAEEAKTELVKLQRAFPQMAEEMRVVKDKIRIPVHTDFTE